MQLLPELLQNKTVNVMKNHVMLFEEYSSDVHIRAIKHFGLTDDPNEVGWMTPDGDMLDFSTKKHGGPPGGRVMDHNEIGYILPDDPTYPNIAYMDMGGVKMKPEAGGFECRIEPTSEQYRVLRWYLDHFRSSTTYIDLYNYSNDRKYSGEYAPGVKAEHILNDVKRFYAGEPMPEWNQVLESSVEEIDYELYEELDEMKYSILEKYQPYTPGKKQPWSVVPFGTLRKVWEDTARYRLVPERQYKNLDMIEEMMKRNTLKLHVNTELSGHTSHDPIEDFKEYYVEQLGQNDEEATKNAQNDCDHYWEYIMDEKEGQPRISD